jgi:aryl-alcohol dehydrogenase-like predicted oxidoreductase
LPSEAQASRTARKRFRNAAACYAARIATLTRAHGVPEQVGLQSGCSLIDRGVELEFDLVPAGRMLGLVLVAWSPLGFGMLTASTGAQRWPTSARRAAFQQGGRARRRQGWAPRR